MDANWKSVVCKYQDKVSRFVEIIHEDEKANLKTSEARKIRGSNAIYSIKCNFSQFFLSK